jgi:hypothetical protein
MQVGAPREIGMRNRGLEYLHRRAHFSGRIDLEGSHASQLALGNP